jgi:D-sedoheptulose 7-phosphate isomerase
MPTYCKRSTLFLSCITKAFKDGKRVYFCGNGGSAADAQHLAAEFSGRFTPIGTRYLLKRFIATVPI